MTAPIPTASTIAESSASAALSPPTRTSHSQFTTSTKRSSAGWNRRQTASPIWFDHLVGGAAGDATTRRGRALFGDLEVDHQSNLVGA